jgi:hypothetical protein
MAYTLADRVRETTTTTGTGSFTLAGAFSNYRAFSDVLATNDFCLYQIVNPSANEWEIGVGKLTGSTTLARTGVLSSSNSNDLVNFSSGTKDIFLVGSAMTDAMFHAGLYGDGSTGDVTISSGTTTLSSDMYYKNLTISGTGSLVTNGWRVFVSEILDLSSAPANAIQWTGNNGSNTTGTGPGFAASSLSTNTVAGTTGSVSGSAGGTAAGTNGTAGTVIPSGNGGAGGVGGAAGAGSSGSGGTSSSGGTITNFHRILWPALSLIRHISDITLTLLQGGACGGSGGSGGGNGSQGGGSGSSGTGGGVVYIAARIIKRSGSTAVGAISVNGGNGGSSGGGLSGTRGGGGGAGGGGGGWIYILFNVKIGSSATGMLRSNGGTGGNGGNQGAGGAPSTAGYSGGGGQAGRITLLDLGTSHHSETFGTSPVAPVAPVGSTGGIGPAGEVNEVNF